MSFYVEYIKYICYNIYKKSANTLCCRGRLKTIGGFAGGYFMKIELFGKNYNPSDSLKAITEKKCAKIERHFGESDDLYAKFVVTLEGDKYTTDLTL